MLRVLILALLGTFLGHTSAQFCDLESCGDAEHIDCWMDAGAWGTKCPAANKNMLNLADVVDQIVGRHNYHRNRYAGGQISGFDTAKRMGAMSWNITLANLARKNVRQCEMKHDGCHNTPEYDFTGQNLAYQKFRKTDTTANSVRLLQMVDSWNAECTKAVMADLNPFKGDKDMWTCAQLLRDTCGLVGCAAMAFEDATWRTIIFGCNYAMGNIQNWPTYKSGATASACKSGKDATYKNLCSTSEPYNYKKFWEDQY